MGVDSERLAQPLLDAGWLIAPGALFSATRAPGARARMAARKSLALVMGETTVDPGLVRVGLDID